jgi:hypothetical protein
MLLRVVMLSWDMLSVIKLTVVMILMLSVVIQILLLLFMPNVNVFIVFMLSVAASFLGFPPMPWPILQTFVTPSTISCIVLASGDNISKYSTNIL